MSEMARFAQAEAALAEGRRSEGIDLIIAQLEENSKAPVGVFRNFGALLVRDKRYETAEQWTRVGLQHYPKEFELWNILGVTLRRQRKFEDAIAALDSAQKISPKNLAPAINKGNIYNDMRDGARALPLWTKLVREQPGNAEFQRSLGRSYWHLLDLEKAEMRMRLASKLKKDYVDAWLDLASVASDRAEPAAALEHYDAALLANPGNPRLSEAKAIMIRRAGRATEAEHYLVSLLYEFGDVGWIHQQLGQTIMEHDRRRAHLHMEKAIELEPDKLDYRMALAESLGRTRTDESKNLTGIQRQ